MDKDGWRPIEEAPPNGTAVIVYFANYTWLGMDGEPISISPLRDHVERTAVGYYDNDMWHESGTAHDMFESWRSEDELPTHWVPLLPPPPSGARP